MVSFHQYIVGVPTGDVIFFFYSSRVKHYPSNFLEMDSSKLSLFVVSYWMSSLKVDLI